MTSVLDQEARRRLEEWLKSTARRAAPGGASPDIHIDELSPKLRNKSSWVLGGLELLELMARTGSLRDARYSACLVIHLDPEAIVAEIGVENPPERWTDAIGITPPELTLVRAEDWSERARYLRDFGRVVGTLPIGGFPATVHLTERVEHYGKEIERVRHIWVVLRGER